MILLPQVLQNILADLNFNIRKNILFNMQIVLLLSYGLMKIASSASIFILLVFLYFSTTSVSLDANDKLLHPTKKKGDHVFHMISDVGKNKQIRK